MVWFVFLLPLILGRFGSILRLLLLVWMGRLWVVRMMVVSEGSERMLALPKDEQQDGVCWKFGGKTCPTNPGWVRSLPVGWLVPTNLGKRLYPVVSRVGTPLRRGKSVVVLGLGPFFGLR